MRIDWLSGGAFLGLVSSLAIANGASALVIDSSNSGLDQGAGCTNTICLPSTAYSLAASAPVSGTLDIAAGTLSFNIQLASATFNAVGGSDGGVTSVTFSNVTYSGSVAVALNGSNNYDVAGSQTASVAGTLTPAGAGSAAGFNLANSVLVTGVCSGTPGSSLQCGLIFGAPGFATSVNGNTRYFRHTVDAFAIVPEPGTALLMGLGLVGLAVRRRI